MDAILNWLWQGAVVALAAAVVLRLTESSRAQARYASIWVALLSILLLPLISMVWSTVFVPSDSSLGGVSIGHVVSMPTGWWTSSRLLIFLWVLWSSLYAARLGAAVLSLRRAQRHCRPVPRDVESRLPSWILVRTAGRPTRLVLSDSVRSAAVLGFGSPVIAVAPALLEHLNDEELDYVVVHEWAHVQRRDDIANLVQLVTSVIAGWHPAVWWVNRQLHIEREIACDQTVVAMGGSAKRYAACLAKLASLPMPALQLPAVAAAVSSSDLGRRIIRILSGHHSAPPRSWARTAIRASVPLLVVALSVGGVRLVEMAETVTAVGSVASRDRVDVLTATPFLSARPTVHPSFSEQTNAHSKAPLNRSRQVGRRKAHEAAIVTALTPRPRSLLTESVLASVPEPEPLHPVASRATVTFALLGSSAPSAPGRMRGTSVVVPSATQTKPWDVAADGGLAVGRASQKAASATAGFFSRFGKNLAGAF